MSSQIWEQLQRWLFDKVERPAEIIGQCFDDHFEGVIIVNVHTEIIYYNKALGLIDDLSPSEALGKTIFDLYRVGDNSILPSMHCLFSRTALRNYACFYRTHQGRLVNSIHNVFPLFSGENLLGCICFISDYGNMSITVANAGNQVSDPPETGRKESARYVFEDIITQNPKFLKVIEEAKRAAGTPSPIMIFGETGTGKEMMAQAIHRRSPRQHKPFMALNCAAIPESLLEGILFGTTKGSFTGALDKPGAMELASGGSLFLDEVNSMPLGLQSKILRAVQEQMVRRVGAAREIPVDLKIISACNIHPKVAVTNGDMRADLFYRLGVVLIAIPPLCDRRDDIMPLTHHFLTKLNRKLGKKIDEVSPQVSRTFMQYHWPGNARELEHALEGAMNIALGTRTLELHHFNDLYANLAYEETYYKQVSEEPLAPLTNQDFSPPYEPHYPPRHRHPAAGDESSELCEIVNALESSSGNVSKAARLLGISPQLMKYRMKKYNLITKCIVNIRP